MAPKSIKTQIDENGRTCITCKRYKAWSKFHKKHSKHTTHSRKKQTSCHSCVRRLQKQYKENNFELWKARSLRGNWLQKAKKLGLPKESVPSISNIKEWLISNRPFTCYYSKEPTGNIFDVDHKQPISRGGSLELNNLCICSPIYNGAKGSLTEQEFKALLGVMKTWEDTAIKSVLYRLRANYFR